MKPSKIVYPFGQVDITLAANESLAVQTVAKASVQRNIGYPNLPSSMSNIGTVNNGTTVFGPYTAGGSFRIVAGADKVAYEKGLDPAIISEGAGVVQGTPGVLNATGALTAAMILSGIVTSTTAAAVAGTLPTGTVMDTECDNLRIGDSFDWACITTGANAFTVTAAASGHTVVGNMVVAAGKAGLFRTRKTAAATFVTYSLANT